MAELKEASAKTGDEALQEVKKVEIEGPIVIEHKPKPSETVTTAEEDRHTKTARQINMIWEVSQAIIAISVVGANIGVAFVHGVEVGAATMLSNAFFLIIGFYFGRTNHARLGGVGDLIAKKT